MSQTLAAPIGILGGTFDPIHLGHIQPALAAMQQLNMTRVRLMPCHMPPHKTAQSSSEHRHNMVALVCQQNAHFEIDTRELSRKATSYSVHTLMQMRAEYTCHPLCFFIGMDSLQNLHTWYRWQQLFELCHLVVYQRPGATQCLPEWVQRQVDSRCTQQPEDLHRRIGGHIYFAKVEPIDTSSTQIRQKVLQGQSISGLVPKLIEDYIYQHKLYLQKT